MEQTVVIIPVISITDSFFFFLVCGLADVRFHSYFVSQRIVS